MEITTYKGVKVRENALGIKKSENAVSFVFKPCFDTSP